MRVIAGEFRSRRLKSIPGDATRPTPDRLRETLFDILQPRIEGASFVDAYAGTGAVGIEALSRGAAHAWFLERDPRGAGGDPRESGVARGGAPGDGAGGAGAGDAGALSGRTSCSWIRRTTWRRSTPAALELLGEKPPALTIAQHSVRLSWRMRTADCIARGW